ncbi:MAG: murein biosynthesis integral membrane protein MurJ [Deltaproteobacteria bacterium]|nr:MAG: murein biosynthesis integral membrane protein MurJ [Deltaproteobacteria bacterium]
MSLAKYTVLLSSFKMASATFVSRILGLVREQVMAAIFGASGFTDAYLVAFRIPNILRDLFAEGSFSPAFVPIFIEERIKDPARARSLLWSLFVLLFFLTGTLSLLIMYFAPELTGLFAPTFVEMPEKYELTVVLIRIMAPFLVLVSLAALFMGALNSLKIFFMPSIAPAFFNVIMILAILFFPPLFQARGLPPILSLGVGVILGGFLQMIVQFPLLIRKGYGPKGPIQPISKLTSRIIKRIGIGTVGMAATQINVLVTTILATGTVVGAVSWLSYAFRLFQFPVGVFGVSIAGSNLVHFSDNWTAGKKEEAIDLLQGSYILCLLVLCPAMALLLGLSSPTVHLIFERGLFNFEDTQMTAMALDFYLVGLPFYGLYKVFVPIFYTLNKPKTPVVISVISILLNILFCILTVPHYGFKVLALGTSLSMLVNSILQATFLKKELGLSLSFFFNLTVLKILFASVVAFTCCYYLGDNFFIFSENFFLKVIKFCLLGLAGALTYLILLLILGEYPRIKKILK